MSEKFTGRLMHALVRRIENAMDQKQRPRLFSFDGGLLILSWIYGLVTQLRLRLYDKGVLKQKSLPCFVISIGNIVAGGAGKTPMAVYLANMLKQSGRKPVVVSRGYKGSYTEDALVVSDGNRIFADASVCGDEPHMLARHKSFPVVVGRNRFAAGKKAIEQFDPDVIILDDGFQHLGLKRDLDLLLFDHSNPLGNGRLLPSGRLREGLDTAAWRAHGVVFTRCRKLDSAEDGPDAREVINTFDNAPAFRTAHEPFIINEAGSPGGLSDITDLNGKKALLFSGIAKNNSFYGGMARCGVNVLEHLEFQDHYRYKKSDFERINRLAEALRVDMILTTRKDAVKLTPDHKWAKPLVVVDIRIRFAAEADFRSFIENKIKKQ